MNCPVCNDECERGNDIKNISSFNYYCNKLSNINVWHFALSLNNNYHIHRAIDDAYLTSNNHKQMELIFYNELIILDYFDNNYFYMPNDQLKNIIDKILLLK